jgi:hypothetical protein
VTVGAGTVPVRAPQVNDKRVDEKGERKRFSSRILPAYLRRSPKTTEALPTAGYPRTFVHGMIRKSLTPSAPL